MTDKHMYHQNIIYTNNWKTATMQTKNKST